VVSQSRQHIPSVPNFAVKAYDLLASAMVQKYSRFLEVRPPPHVDLVFVVEPVRKRFDFRKFNAPTAYYAIDSHLAFRQHIRDVRVQDYDFVFGGSEGLHSQIPGSWMRESLLVASSLRSRDSQKVEFAYDI
jgi:hypothetical protein